MGFLKKTKFPIKGERERRKKAGEEGERQGGRKTEILPSELPQMTSRVQLCGQCCLEISSGYPDASLAVLMPTLALTADYLPFHWTHTSLSLWVPLDFYSPFWLVAMESSWQPPQWFPWIPSTLRQAAAQSRWPAALGEDQAEGISEWSSILYPFVHPFPKILCVCVCTGARVRTHTSLPRSCLVWPWQGAHDVSNVTSTTTTIAYIYWTPIICQTIAYEMACILRERNNLPGQFKEFSFSDPIQTLLFGPSLLGICVDCWYA